MARLFFLISGEFETLSFSELKAILETEGYNYEVNEKLDQTVRLESDIEAMKLVVKRSAFTRICAKELFACNADDTSIIEASKATTFKNIISEKDSFEVRIRRIKEYATKDTTMKYERLLGKAILDQVPKAKVDLKHPTMTFFGILTNGKLIFGVKMAEIIPKPFVERRARKKPFFHPSAMNAKLARCMVNLAHAPIGGYLLDPFCGTGSTVIEAKLIGCQAVGIDVQRRMAKGALRNIRHFNLNPEGIIIGDARKIPLRKIDCVVTDPPYGKSSTTLKRTTNEIVEGILMAAYEILNEGQRVCIASPKTLNISRIGKRLNYGHLESHFAYVHRSLTREVAVFQKVQKS